MRKPSFNAQAPILSWVCLLLLAIGIGGSLPCALAEGLLLTGATVHTVSGETFAPGQVLIQDGKIAAVGKTVAAGGAASR
jgi:hypothetical protein